MRAMLNKTPRYWLPFCKALMSFLVCGLFMSSALAVERGLPEAPADGAQSSIPSSGLVAGSDEAKARQDLRNRVAKVLDQREQAREEQDAGKVTKDDMEKASDLRTEAFSEVVGRMFPLQPHEIKTLRRMYNKTQRAGAFTGDVPAKPTSSSRIVNLSPGTTPPVVRLNAGFVTSLVFLDSTGAPWPIKAFDIGNPSAFNVQWNQGTAQEAQQHNSMSNTLLIQAISMYKQGNLAVMLEGLNTPIMLTLLPGQKIVDYRVDLQVPRAGPNARASRGGLPATENPQLLDVLNNITPMGAKPLHVQGGAAKAWLQGDHMFVRTAMTVVSPSWIATMSSSDDAVHAYELPPTSVLLALYDGRMQKLTVEGL